MAAGTRGGEDRSAKDVFDKIGEKIQKEAHEKALDRAKGTLQGNLSLAVFDRQQIHIKNPCELDHTKHTNVTNIAIKPCDRRAPDRFPDDNRSQCTKNRIRDSTSDTVGACAPYRRLHVCDYNLEEISDYKNITNHTLLADVLLAAKFEGQSIMNNSANLGNHNKSGICTVLARSFADIGDIIRGKDLYRGNKQEKDRLQNKLKEYFEKIYNNLNDPQVQSHYKNDDDPNFYQLREDWWAINRDQVWKAITCNADNDAYYFRPTCSGGRNATTKQCRCASGDCPTYFDYVPQYLRWFEEWSEEFCRKRNLKLQNAITNCRGMDDDGKEKYCSRNGYDCTKTIRSIDKYSMNRECAKCLYVCDPYVKWIDNKKKEFEKQKEKCEIEIYDDTATSQSSTKVYNNMYETHFYEHLKKDYQSMNDFLKLLNSETPCTNIIDPKSKIDFTKDPDDIFCHTEYCEPCPWCGLKKENGKWIRRADNDPDCPKKAPYKPPPGVKPTEIDVIQKDKNGKDIVQMFQNFCNKDNKLGIKNEQWKCYYQEGNDKCVLENGEELGGEKKIKEFDDFLMFWVTHMLKDSIEWRSKLGKCLKNDKKTCIRKCNDNCKCYKKWVEQKKKEWKQIKTHFDKQTDFMQFGHYFVLETFLEGDQFFTDVTKAYGDENEIVHIQKMMEKKKQQDQHRDTSKTNTIIDELLDHEKEEANKCLGTHTDNDCPDPHPDHDSDSEDDYEDIPQRQNPCATASGSTYPVLANKVASNMHHKVHAEAKSRSGGKNLLKANAKEGTYSKGGIGKNLDATFCNINEKYSNSTSKSRKPCDGKDKERQRFKVGTPWEGDSFVNSKYPEAYMPPRRQHICTSNLEFLQTDDSPLNGKDNGGDKVNDAFLGDVLLSAKMDAEKIKKLYKEHNRIREINNTKDKETICRAIRNSFADIGDIIKGTDIWDHEDFKTLEEYLLKIFEKIKTQLPKEIQGKYKDISPYLDLRKDWWEANRRQVWKAMQCTLKELKISTGDCAYSRGTHPPYDDYIPQRLRWMSEWAEWYCKEQSRLYNKLVADCGDCMKKGEGGKECMNGSGECRKCKQACEEYKAKIKKWQEQWDKMQLKYLYFYHEAKTTSRHGIDAYSGAVEPKDKPVVKFLQELQKAIKTTGSPRSKRSTRGTTTDPPTPYSTAAGYIHQEMGPNVGCKGQEVFCSEAGEKYAFKDPPQGYDTACKCDKNLPKSPAKEEKKEDDACEIVKKLLGNEKAPEYKEACDLKYEGKKERYTQWNCTNKIKNGEKNDVVCIPPRRQKLYLGSLEKLNGGKSQQELRTAFIKCAAMETVFAWHKYKEDKKKEREEKEKQGGSYIFLEDEKEPSLEPDAELDGGTIPGPFKRQLFYSFGDYRDICLGKDIGRDMKDVENKIKGVFSKYGKNIDEERKNWWNTNGPHIWEGMICALSYDIKNKTFINEVHTELNKKNNYKDIKLTSKNRQNDTTLSDFVTVPQFIRWFQEWSEEFCRKRKDKLAQIKEDCRSDKPGKRYCSGDGHDCTNEKLKHNDMFADLYCPDCKKACTKYNKWIQKKVEEFYNQKCKYKKEFVKTSINLDSKYVKNIYGTSEGKYKSAETFLDILKDGSDCSMNTVDGKVDFKKTLKTFSPSTYCKTCPLYGVKCKNASEDCTHNSANGNKWEKNLDSLKIKNEKPTSIDVEMIDNRAQYIEEDLKKFYKPSCLLKSVREQKWQCSFINKKMDVCNLTNIQNSIDIDNDGIITFKVLLELWLKDFLEGYYISKKKIETCTKNKENKCIKGCKGKCKCVDEWLKQKEKEWEKINEHFNKQEHDIGNDMAYKVISYCEKNESEVKKSIDNFEHLKKVEQYEECNGHNNCTSMDGKRKKDIVTILLSELKEKINKCNDQHDETPPKTCENPPHSDETLDPLVEDSPPEDAQKPAFCPTEDIVEEPEVVPSGPTDACDIVKPLLDNNDGTIKIGGCNHKYHPNEESYPKWDCHNYIDTKYNGACMPPRRIKLCLYYLKELNVQTETKEEELRKAFIQSAGVETFFAWHKYKKDKKKEEKTRVKPGDPDSVLRSGIIPDEFKRIMFYTFGDYRDICLDTDISKKIPGSDVSNAKEKIGKVFSNGADKSPSGKTREQWWNENGPKIWEAMFCALENFGADKETLIKAYNYNNVTFDNPSGTKLTEFVNRSQFLRWMIEWSEHFCKEQKKEYEKLQAECDKCTVSTDGTVSNEDCKTKCTQCKKKCEEYKAFITKWQREWTKQSDKYKEIYTKATTNGSSSDPIETKLLQYLKNLKEQNGNSDVYSSAGGYLEKEGYIDDCNESKQKDFRDNSKDDEKYAFRNYPYEHETKCECKEEPPPEPAEDNRGRSKTGEDADTVPPKEQDEVVEPKETPASPDNGEESPEYVPEKKVPVPAPKEKSKPKKRPPRQVTRSILPEMVSISAFPLSVGIAFAALSYFVLKKKSKSAIDFLRVIDIPKGDYGIPTLKSKNRYIPYTSDRYKGKTYIYMEGDADEDKYTFMSDTTDITSSSESEYEEIDINDIYVPGSPKYKTLIEVVLEPSKRDIQSDDIPMNKFTDEEWNQLKHDFISNMLQNQPNDVSNDYKSGNVTLNTQPNTLYFDKPEEKPFITSIHDRNLYSGEEISYNINMTNNDDIPMSDKNDVYSGIDLINDSLNNDQHVDIYDELLKRKENELFGTNHTKHTTTNSIGKQTHTDPILNQINLFHKWLDRHRNMCEQWNNNERLYKLKELWDDKDNNNSSFITVSSDSNIQDGDIKTLNTDVSIQIDMDDPKPINQYTNMYTNPHNSTTDTILNDMEKHREPYFYDIYEDDITYFDIEDEKTPMGDIYVDNNNADVLTKVQIEMNIANNKKEIFEEEYPISDIWYI
ncbi:erythrocyte membrane protein 1, PfEMP1, putative [Plasmodium sp. gorilla clade G1]|nr:erythrocyte membrane protein 1, PfEMP1, putative [Plasmodium sp. gorilla clade G1]